MRRAALALLLFGATTAIAQSMPVRRDCRFEDIEQHTGSRWYDERPSIVFHRDTALAAMGRWSDLTDSLRSRFLRRLGEVPGTLPDADRAKALRRIDTLRAKIAAGPSPGDFGIRLSNQDAAGVDTLYVAFGGTVDSVIAAESLPAEAGRRAVCWLGHEAANVAQMRNNPDQAAFLTFLNSRVERWESFRSNGMPMMPLELFLNGTRLGFKRATLEPPRRQWIVAHPSVALAARPSELTRAKEVLVFELIGIAWYPQDYKRFYSVAPVVAFGTERRAAWGGMLRFGRTLSAGAFYGDSPGNDRKDWSIIASTDLLNGLSAVSGKLRGEIEALRVRVAECTTSFTGCMSK